MENSELMCFCCFEGFHPIYQFLIFLIILHLATELSDCLHSNLFYNTVFFPFITLTYYLVRNRSLHSLCTNVFSPEEYKWQESLQTYLWACIWCAVINYNFMYFTKLPKIFWSFQNLQKEKEVKVLYYLSIVCVSVQLGAVQMCFLLKWKRASRWSFASNKSHSYGQHRVHCYKAKNLKEGYYVLSSSVFYFIFKSRVFKPYSGDAHLALPIL